MVYFLPHWLGREGTSSVAAHVCQPLAQQPRKPQAAPPLAQPSAQQKTAFRRGFLNLGAQERIRISPVLPASTETSASTNSSTWACDGVCRYTYDALDNIRSAKLAGVKRHGYFYDASAGDVSGVKCSGDGAAEIVGPARAEVRQS